MPELPEVESIRLGLQKKLVGQRVTNVHLARTDIIRSSTLQRSPKNLLNNCKITAIHRQGKQLAIVGQDTKKTPRNPARQPAICIQLGMSGSLTLANPQVNADHHCHIIWSLTSKSINNPTKSAPNSPKRLIFRDPRRFGCIRTFPSLQALQNEHWKQLGPDALTIETDDLHTRLKKTTPALKAALLDQNLIAGLGNIYVDELLFVCQLHPLLPANKITTNQSRLLVTKMRPLLQNAIHAGGSTLRDHRNAAGQPGDYQKQHLVYGHANEPCSLCGRKLKHLIVAGRSTVFCPNCQRKNPTKQTTRPRPTSAGSPI